MRQQLPVNPSPHLPNPALDQSLEETLLNDDLQGHIEPELDIDEEYSKLLLSRIASLELEQQTSREQIEQLSRDKQRFEQALLKLRAEKNLIREKQHNNDALQSKLSSIIQAKETEEQTLREKVVLMQRETEAEIARLRAERDAALALTQQFQNHTESWSELLSARRLLILLPLAIMLALALLGLVWLL